MSSYQRLKAVSAKIPYDEVILEEEPKATPPALRFNLRTKLILPYLILTVTVAVIAAYLITRVVLSSWTERFQNQLVTAADEAADVLVRYEQSQLATWRQIAFTQGVAEATAAQSVADLEQLIEPIFLTNSTSRLDILNENGVGVWQRDQNREDSADIDYTQWALVKQILADPANRYAGLQIVNDKAVFYTGGALIGESGQTRGVLLVGRSLDVLASTLQESVLAGITLYAPDGALLATTIGQADVDALTLPANEATQVLAQQATRVRIRTIEPAGDQYAQVLTPFKLQGQDLGILGTSLRHNLLASPLYPARHAVTAVFAVTVSAILVIGYVLAAHIVRPVERLTAAARQLATGDLTVQVPATTHDEIGQLTHTFNDMVTQLRQRRYIEDLFGRYVGDDIAQRILNGEVKLGGQRVHATVLFADIRNFTSFTERADLSNLIEELNEYYEVMQGVIDGQGGVINKFGGDSILALFGAPVPFNTHAQRAVITALKMLDVLDSLNERRAASGKAPFRIGIGINTGSMIVGNLGSEQRREYTVLGDSVNAAKRLSDLNKKFPLYSIFASGSTVRELDGHNRWPMKNLGQIHVKGKEAPVDVYALSHLQPVGEPYEER